MFSAARGVRGTLHRTMATMRAIRVNEFGAPAVMRVESDVAIPTAGPKQTVVRLHAAGVNPVDTYLRAGAYAKLPALPFTPGKDGAGIVHEVGDGVTNIKQGDRVYILGSLSGSYAEYSLCDANFVFPLPDNVSFQQGACLGVPTYTAYRALYSRGRAKAGEKLLVHGASGGVGLAAVQMARADGLFVVGTAGTPQGMEAVRNAGAHVVVNHRDAGSLEELKAVGGFDLCLEMASHVNLATDFSLMNTHGRVMVIGSRGPLEINPRDIMSKELEVRGIMLFTGTPEDFATAHASLYARLEAGTYVPTVGVELGLADAPEAHREVIEHSRGTAGNIILSV